MCSTFSAHVNMLHLLCRLTTGRSLMEPLSCAWLPRHFDRVQSVFLLFPVPIFTWSRFLAFMTNRFQRRREDTFLQERGCVMSGARDKRLRGTLGSRSIGSKPQRLGAEVSSLGAKCLQLRRCCYSRFAPSFCNQCDHARIMSRLPAYSGQMKEKKLMKHQNKRMAQYV